MPMPRWDSTTTSATMALPPACCRCWDARACGSSPTIRPSWKVLHAPASRLSAASRCRGRSIPTTGAISPPRQHAPATSSITSSLYLAMGQIYRSERAAAQGELSCAWSRDDMTPPSRLIGNLAYPDVSRYLQETSILCLPLGAIEQHGAYLPL